MYCTKHKYSWCACQGSTCPHCKAEEEALKKEEQLKLINNVSNNPNINKQ
jgi:hypothetical protein